MNEKLERLKTKEELEFSERLRRNVEDELSRIFTEYRLPDVIIDEIVDDVKLTSDYELGSYSFSDILFGIQRVLVDHLDVEVY